MKSSFPETKEGRRIDLVEFYQVWVEELEEDDA